MAEPWKPADDWDERRGELLARREEQRRLRSRRRRIAAGVLVLVAASAVAVVLLASSGGGDHTAVLVPGAGRSRSSGGAGSAPSGGAGPVRNSTPQPGWGPHTGPVPILEYHVLGSPEQAVPYPELYVARPDFHRQMDWLERAGYQAVTLEQVEEAWSEGGSLPPKPVVLSFDDGYRPQYTYALPELRRHGWAGVLNLKAEGSDLYPSNVEAMIAAGWELAAHTIHHLDLTTLDASQLREETAGARAILRREYGVPVRNFCYPAGRFDSTVIAAVKAAGYTGATTEVPGYASRDRPYELNRFEVLRSSGVGGVAADLRSG